MAQSVIRQIADRPDGRFDPVVVLGSKSVYARRGFMTLQETENELELLKIIMAACGTFVVHDEVSCLPRFSPG